ncbi:MAG: HAMP domain-containing sensor histidine kinase [Candidatus Daviesbacteria bacterium]|nr:HAMP domain-containing sensor histidine kinase [Candidatus Daviesbacteria bacterium]
MIWFLVILLIIIVVALTLYILSLKKKISFLKKNEIKKMEDRRSGFISIISHQLRTPLSVVKGYLESLAEGDVGKLEVAQQDYIDDALKINRETIVMVNNYLDAIRLDAKVIDVKPEEVNMVEITKEAVEKLKILARAYNCDLVFNQPTENISAASADKIKIKQVIENIIANALKYTSGKGSATISLEEKDGYIIFICQDTGIGIPADQQEELFTKFFRAKNVIHKDTKGSGLGLYFAKIIIESLGGKIWVESVENKGTKVSFKLPKYTNKKNATTT